MDQSQFLLFLFGVITVLAVPGPTNTLLAAAGVGQGLRRSWKLPVAEAAGYIVNITVWGGFLNGASHALPWLPPSVRMACGLYIAYLAVRMWRAATVLATEGHTATLRMRDLFLATLFNPKGILFGGTIFPAAAFTTLPAYAQAMGVFVLAVLPIGSLWIAFGSHLASGRIKWLRPQHVQRGASVVLGAFSVSLAWAAIHWPA
ncbi:multidrug transporter MatE [Bordetella sp. H567]|uniref:LysE family translocator n=1 Tax=Bordetella sp. H567 TaxID=1697043 RepID=UPI00081CDCB0|nr:LysE family translocator [Bordetella sp. H567]AOB31246.1 multidrug transporter MatE [Bordetella sp. H567]